MSKKDRKSRDPGADLFQVPEQAMSDDVTDAARILRSFVSQVDTAVHEGSQDRLYGAYGANAPIEPFPFPEGEVAEPLADDEGISELLEQADHVSNHLTDAMEFVPRVVEGASGVFSLHPKEDTPRSMSHPPIRLRYKGKATKRQLERLRQRIQAHTQEH